MISQWKWVSLISQNMLKVHQWVTSDLGPRRSRPRDLGPKACGPRFPMHGPRSLIILLGIIGEFMADFSTVPPNMYIMCISWWIIGYQHNFTSKSVMCFHGCMFLTNNMQFYPTTYINSHTMILSTQREKIFTIFWWNHAFTPEKKIYLFISATCY